MGILKTLAACSPCQYFIQALSDGIKRARRIHWGGIMSTELIKFAENPVV